MGWGYCICCAHLFRCYRNAYLSISTSEIILFLFYFSATSMAITVGYHRLFSHVTYSINNIIRFFLLFFGSATYEQSVVKWASQHRQHHQFTDTDKDFHNSKKGILVLVYRLGALLTNGEGYHSFHHRFPNDYRNGIQWYNWDPSKWVIPN
jgi:fatty-acid desaturase